jgi:multiple sugar transport system substrate-binding protein
MKSSKILVFVIVGLLLFGLAVISQAQQITLTVVYHLVPGVSATPAFVTWFDKVIPEFEASHSNVKVELMPIMAAEQDYYTKLDLIMRSPSTAPDVVSEDTFMIGSDAAAGYLLPLNKYVDQWPDWEHFYPAMQQITTINGNIYGIMDGSDVRGLWYNKDVLKEAGIAIPWQPNNWEDILETAQLIKDKVPGVIPLSLHTGNPVNTMEGFYMLLYGTEMGNNALYDWSTNKWVISSPGWNHALTFIQEVFKKGLGEPVYLAMNPQYANILAGQYFPQGKVAIDLWGMWQYSSWLSSSLTPWPNWENVLGFAMMPTEYGQAPGYVSLSGGWALSIPSNSKYPDLAWDLIKDAESAANLAIYDYYTANTAVRDDEINYSIYANSPFAITFANIMKYTHYRPAGFSVYPAVSYQVGLAMGNAMLGKPIEDIMSAYAKAVEGIVGIENTESIK